MFELDNPVTAFKAAEFTEKITTNPSDKLELMSASRKRPGISIHGIGKFTSQSDNTLTYKKIDEKGRVGGLVFRGADIIGIHAYEDKSGQGATT